MEIVIIDVNKKAFLDLLLLADEDEGMIDRYLERGTLFALYDGDLRAVCVVTEEGNDIEIQNLATYPRYQRQGFGSALIRHVRERYAGRNGRLLVGTGDTPRSVGFYERRGFTYSHRLENYIADHYPEPIIEDGIMLVDKVYLSMPL